MGGIKNFKRQCIICNKVELIRKDSKAIKCGTCSRKESLIKAGEVLHQLALEKKHACPICSKLVNKKYVCCSVKCKKEYTKKIELICETCIKPFIKLRSTLSPYNKTTNARGRFCSKKCYTEWQKQ